MSSSHSDQTAKARQLGRTYEPQPLEDVLRKWADPKCKKCYGTGRTGFLDKDPIPCKCALERSKYNLEAANAKVRLKEREKQFKKGKVLISHSSGKWNRWTWPHEVDQWLKMLADNPTKYVEEDGVFQVERPDQEVQTEETE